MVWVIAVDSIENCVGLKFDYLLHRLHNTQEISTIGYSYKPIVTVTFFWSEHQIKLRNLINSLWIHLKISFIIRSWWLSWLHQYGSFQVWYLPEWQIKSSSEENLQNKLSECQNFILLLRMRKVKSNNTSSCKKSASLIIDKRVSG